GALGSRGPADGEGSHQEGGGKGGQGHPGGESAEGATTSRTSTRVRLVHSSLRSIGIASRTGRRCRVHRSGAEAPRAPAETAGARAGDAAPTGRGASSGVLATPGTVLPGGQQKGSVPLERDGSLDADRGVSRRRRPQAPPR